jgi:hypothetical protein
MVMKRFLLSVVAVAGLASAGACDKPTGDDCRSAITNMEKLLGNDPAASGRTSELEGEVRRCKGGSSREAVACANQATTVAALKACDFMTAKPKK